MATIDVLGEEITTWEEARHIGYEYENVFRAIDEQGLDSNVSVKLTGLGLKLDRPVSRDLERLVRQAAERRNSAGSTWRTRAARTRRCASTASCARLARQRRHRAPGVPAPDARRHPSAFDLSPNVRLCKGDLRRARGDRVPGARRGPRELRAGARRAPRGRLVRRDRDADEWLIEEGERLVREAGRSPSDYEFQMLLGVRPSDKQLVEQGHRLRYVACGEEWPRTAPSPAGEPEDRRSSPPTPSVGAPSRNGR